MVTAAGSCLRILRAFVPLHPGLPVGHLAVAPACGPVAAVQAIEVEEEEEKEEEEEAEVAEKFAGGGL